jgi:hypothetical protein
MTYRIPKGSIECRFERDNVDMVPYGMGNTAMHTFECVYEGSDDVWKQVEKYMDAPEWPTKGCGPLCPGYTARETRICPTHDYEYTDYCSKCMEGD